MFNIFGNKVRIKSSPETDAKGLSGKTGTVYGTTTPSMMDFEIIGTPKNDFAINVQFEDLRESFWFDEDLLEHIDNGEGYVITLDGTDKKWTKEKSGEWKEEETTPKQNTQTVKNNNAKQYKIKKKWWKFWE